jgi:hypothetical protein
MSHPSVQNRRGVEHSHSAASKAVVPLRDLDWVQGVQWSTGPGTCWTEVE